jgi:hypothetical protein
MEEFFQKRARFTNPGVEIHAWGGQATTFPSARAALYGPAV